MNLEIEINEKIKEAMKAKDKDRLNALRAIKSAILLAKTEKGASETLSQDVEIKILQKLYKQRKESYEIFTQQDRKDLAAEELSQLKVIEEFLPKPLSDEELTDQIKSIIMEVGASTTSDFGKVMAVASKKLAGRADGKAISEKVKSLLS